MQGTTNGRAAHARSKNLAAVAALAAALAGVPAATAAQVEFALPGGEGRQERAVMSGREFDALSESVGFDPAQRTAADAIFDDAQARAAFMRALDEGAANPNARPRAEDLVATIVSMADARLALDEVAAAKIAMIRAGLVDPW